MISATCLNWTVSYPILRRRRCGENPLCIFLSAIRSKMSSIRHIILFDGVCNLCSGAVQFVIKYDKKNIFRFAALQSETGRHLLMSYGLPGHHLKSFVYIGGDKVFTRSEAALKVAARLSYPVKLLSVFVIIPGFIRNFMYEVIARNRYRLFGKKETCMMPTGALKERFID